MILCIGAAFVISGVLNIMSGIAFTVTDYSNSINNYSSCGTALFISSAFLIAGTVLAAFERVLLPALFDVVGTAFYIYTVKTIYAIPNSEIPKISTEPLAEKQLFTIIVTVLLAVLAFLNYFSEKNSSKREKKRRDKFNRENRRLTDSEKIL